MDTKITAKIDELNQIKNEIDKLELLHEFVPGEKLKINTTEEVFQAGELHIMEDIALAEYKLLLMPQAPNDEYKPQSLRNWIDLKRNELKEHREMQEREGLRLTNFKYIAEVNE